MGVCLGLMLEPEVSDAQEMFDTDGKSIASELEALDAICEKVGVTLLSEFIDTSAYDYSEEEMEDIPEEFQEEVPPNSISEVGYRPCSELQATVAAILGQLGTADGSKQFSAELAAAISEDLTLLQKSLAIASQAGASCMLYLW